LLHLVDDPMSRKIPLRATVSYHFALIVISINAN
jgi:hypothetical protein